MGGFGEIDLSGLLHIAFLLFPILAMLIVACIVISVFIHIIEVILGHDDLFHPIRYRLWWVWMWYSAWQYERSYISLTVYEHRMMKHFHSPEMFHLWLESADYIVWWAIGERHFWVITK